MVHKGVLAIITWRLWGSLTQFTDDKIEAKKET